MNKKAKFMVGIVVIILGLLLLAVILGVVGGVAVAAGARALANDMTVAVVGLLLSAAAVAVATVGIFAATLNLFLDGCRLLEAAYRKLTHTSAFVFHAMDARESQRKRYKKRV